MLGFDIWLILILILILVLLPLWFAFMRDKMFVQALGTDIANLTTAIQDVQCLLNGLIGPRIVLPRADV